MAWTGLYDEESFFGYVMRQTNEALQALNDPELDRDGTTIIVDRIKRIADFLRASKSISGPSDLLQPIPDKDVDNLFVLVVHEWRGYYLLNQEAQSYYGFMATNEADISSARLQELTIRRPGST